jgi:hypothetical protein
MEGRNDEWAMKEKSGNEKMTWSRLQGQRNLLLFLLEGTSIVHGTFTSS